MAINLQHADNTKHLKYFTNVTVQALSRILDTLHEN